ncbi:hypothetical protein GLOIN_2v1773466 [Rhizophagus clarus]|uniref:Uncharacterized protein n=1 Tax=Rhizophagus clarus TaxID=94130 RepID=A0A8H3QCK6_9GLOM|nr:hypothetical protein GLOIN_2v1773466 [Rhizophagus clarus]
MRFGIKVKECRSSSFYHSMVNREGKQLNYYQSFLRGKKYDERCYKTIEIHNKAGVSYTHRDRSEIKRTLVLPAVNSCSNIIIITYGMQP